MLSKTCVSLRLLRPTQSPLLFVGGGSGGGNNSFQEMFAKAREQQQQCSGGGCGPFGGAINPFAMNMGGGMPHNGSHGMLPNLNVGTALRGDEFIDVNTLSAMRDKMQQTFSPEMLQSVHKTIQQGMQGGGMPGGMGMMAFGVGENENGKRVAKAAKVFVDNNGNVTKEYKEQQIDPDDMLPKADGANSYEDATEVSFEENGANSRSSGSNETINEMEIEIESEDVTSSNGKK